MQDVDPVRRAIHGHLTDREYAAACEAEAQRYRQALEEIEALFARPFIDGKTVAAITRSALVFRPFANPTKAPNTVLAMMTA